MLFNKMLPGFFLPVLFITCHGGGNNIPYHVFYHPSFTVTFTHQTYQVVSSEDSVMINPGSRPVLYTEISMNQIGGLEGNSPGNPPGGYHLIFGNGFTMVYLHNVNALDVADTFKNTRSEIGNASLLLADQAFLESCFGRQIVINHIQPQNVIMTGVGPDQANKLQELFGELYAGMYFFARENESKIFPRIMGKGIEYGSKERLQQHVEKLSKDFYPRNINHIDNLNKTADYIRSQFEGSGGIVSEQLYQVHGKTFRNIMVRFGLPDKRRIVVGAHYDTYKDSPGADDNASGVSGLIELAFLLGSNPLPDTFCFELVAYATEEPPMYNHPKEMGSGIHSAGLLKDSIPVEFMMSIDQIGYFSNKTGSQRFPFDELMTGIPGSKADFITLIGSREEASQVSRIVDAMSKTTNLPIFSLVLSKDSVMQFAPCDILQYWNLGYRGMLLTDTAPYRGKHRHSKGDRSAILSYGAMRAVVKSLFVALLEYSR